ncbi:MAG: TIGR03862 family flavoprotein [Pseudomonadota bacterium]
MVLGGVMDTETTDALVIGAGPAGLMAAEMLANRGHSVVIADAMPSAGRKLLMAGKSGLNITKAENTESFLAAYQDAVPHIAPMIGAFGPDAAMEWARDLGQAIFTGSSGHVFPVAMKASPLLRAWLKRLEDKGATLRRRWRWTAWDGEALLFNTPDGTRSIQAASTVLALGGASWARLGSDGTWATRFAANGLPLAPFQPANMGFVMDWSAHMAAHFGAPVKPVGLHAGDQHVTGEFVISARGLEGSGIYAIYRPLRDGAPLTLDLLPDLTPETVTRRLTKRRKGDSIANHLRRAVGLDGAKRALLMELHRQLPDDPAALADLLKALPVPHGGPRPMDEAISTAGGVAWAALSKALMLRDRPGTFCAGEMLDWEAPTGGYLITGCLATGRWAGLAAANWMEATG